MNAMSAPETIDCHDFPVLCRNIHKRFGGRKVLDDVSLSIPKGAVLGLVGSNGAGKTTLMRILVGLLMPESGSAMLLDEPALRPHCHHTAIVISTVLVRPA